jgi:tetratricopeptide (TPR) repeat protein
LNGDQVFIVGAGGSAAQPADLPPFDRLRRSLLDGVGVEASIATTAKSLAPETFMRALYEGRLPLEQWLTQVLSRGSPNAVHTSLATAISDGATVWTVNIDELIEEAARDLGVPLSTAAYPDPVPDISACLLKPHGTVTNGKYIFRADQVVKPLTPGWRDRLQEDMRGAEVIVIGYAGLDIDLRVVLQESLTTTKSVKWFAIEADQQALQERFVALTRPGSGCVGGHTPSELTSLFVEWADGRGLTRRLSDDLRHATLEPTGLSPILKIKGSPRLARALLYERCGYQRDTRRAYRSVIWHRPWSKSARTATSRLIKLDLYKPSRWARAVLALSATRAAGALPHRIRRRLDRVHVTLLSSHDGEHERALQRAKSAIDPGDSAILISQAKAARYLGDLTEAIELAEKACQVSEDAGEVDEAAHARFELGFAHMWAGDLDKARAALGGLSNGLDGLASARWIAWAQWQHACLSLYDNEPLRSLELVEGARSLFVADGLANGEVSCLTVAITAHRMNDDSHRFQETVDELKGMKGGSGWNEFTQLSIDQETAEWARVHGDQVLARSLLDGLIDGSSDRPIHLVLGLLGRAELDRSDGHDNAGDVAAARDVAARHGLRFALVHAVISDYLAGRLESNAALDKLGALNVPLNTRTNGAATSPGDYCLGHHPDAHELFLP